MQRLLSLKDEAEKIDYRFDRPEIARWRREVEAALKEAFGKYSSYEHELNSVRWFKLNKRSTSAAEVEEEFALARAQTRAVMNAAAANVPPPQVVTSKTLYLAEVRARRLYTCAACADPIHPGEVYYRHDPHPYARQYRGEQRTQWCHRCIESSPAQRHWPTSNLRVPAVRVLRPAFEQRLSGNLFEPLRVEIVGVGRVVSELLSRDLSAIYTLTPEQFEEFVCDRLHAMGYEPRRVGRANSADGGIDIVFWSGSSHVLPVLGAAQVKHHRSPRMAQGPAAIREFAGAVANQSFSAALFVTNTQFTPSAKWFAQERAALVRLRDFEDIRRWVAGRFLSAEEWREIPAQIELAPGCVIPIRPRRETAG
jgi:hypothetical protein